MKSNIVRAAFASIIFALATAGTLAAPGDPIPGTEVGLEGDPEGIIVAEGVTNRIGQVDLGVLAPGRYIFVIDAKGLAAAIGKLAPSNTVVGTKEGVSIDLGAALTTIVRDGAQLQLSRGKLVILQDYRPGKDARFAFKVAENESPRPQDRLFTISVMFPDSSPR